ncbi:alcohol dehydrogenase catalytic domain-containing protein [Nisaea sp.]|uniref:alcohol dehydrogenase catalytic domain-containing protein n=1 Tax=Nisaea sp. TaxID=2024842 RepID=UPI0032967D30
MRALVYTGPESLEMRNVPDAEPATDELLVRVEAVGICGSDMHAYLGHDERRPAPLILGHEAAGSIVQGPRTGERVTVNPLVACGVCRACIEGRANLCPDRQIISMPPREGAFATHLAIPARNVVTVPEHVSSVKASLAEPMACGWHAVGLAERILQRSLSSSACLVLGGGAIGLGAALVLESRGAGEIWIAETNSERRSTVSGAGNFRVFDPAEPGSGPKGGAIDLVVDAVGIEATRASASAAAKPGGVIVHIGLGQATGGLDIRRMTLQEITFIGTYTYTPTDFRDTAHAIFDGRLGALDWAEERPLEDGPGAFAEIHAGRVGAPKTILRP